MSEAIGTILIMGLVLSLLLIGVGLGRSDIMKDKKPACEKTLVLRADTCTFHYLTTDEVLLIPRLQEEI